MLQLKQIGVGLIFNHWIGGSETEHQVVEKLNKLPQQNKEFVATDGNFMTNIPLNKHYTIHTSHIHLMRSSIPGSFK